jgi:hypothetical protein
MMAEAWWVNKMIEHGRVIFDVFSSVGTVTGYRLDSWASIPGRARDFFFSPVPSLLYYGYQRNLSLGCKAASI